MWNSKFDRAFTLVELFVVIAMLSLLIAIILPAVQASREASRHASCLANLRQLALASQNYITSHGTLPYGHPHV